MWTIIFEKVTGGTAAKATLVRIVAGVRVGFGFGWERNAEAQRPLMSLRNRMVGMRIGD